MTPAEGKNRSRKRARKLVIIVGSLTIGGVTIPIKPGAMVSATLKIQCAPPAGQTLYFDNLSLALWAMTPYREAEGGALPLPPVR